MVAPFCGTDTGRLKTTVGTVLVLTEVMVGADAIATLMSRLSASRPVFHSEADFQHALAWEAQLVWPEQLVQLETRPAKGMHLDVLLVDPLAGHEVALELKFLTASWQGIAHQEAFNLLSQGAQDIRAYDCVKDVGRVEKLVHNRPSADGAVVVLSNDPNYWTPRSHGRITNAHEFRIHEGAVLSGLRTWGPRTGVGTLRNRESPIALMGSYLCHWRDYSTLPGPSGRFRYLLLAVRRSELTAIST